MNKDIRSLVPHGGEMCLLERIIRWDERSITTATTSHGAPHNPLRRHGKLNAIHLCEYGAQAMAVHGGLLSGGGGVAAGMLVALRDVVLSVEHVENLAGELLVEAECLQRTGAGRQYAFCVLHGGTELARGRAAVIEKSGSA